MKDCNKWSLLILLCVVIFVVALITEVGELSDQIKDLDADLVGISNRLDKLEEDQPVIEVATATDTEAEEEPEIYSPSLSEPQEDTEEAEVDRTALETTEAKEEASEEVVEATTEVFTESKGELEYAGIFELTAYTWTGNTCANGNYPTAGYTVASNYFPLGTRIYIEGYGEFVVEDTGAMASNVVDIYIDSYDSCIEFGRRQAGIYVVK